MTIFEHIESIKNQCELLLKELEEGKEPLATWYHENTKNITFKNTDNGNK